MSVKVITYDFIPQSIIGSVWMAATKKGLISVDFDRTEIGFIKGICESFRVHFDEDKGNINSFSEKITAYLEGNLTELDLVVDLSNRTAFQQKVLIEVKKIPFGQTITYGDLAKRIGDSKALRAVGQALRRNPVPIAVPCHRVLHSDGTLGGYGGVMGSERKIELLKLEGVILA